MTVWTADRLIDPRGERLTGILWNGVQDTRELNAVVDFDAPFTVAHDGDSVNVLDHDRTAPSAPDVLNSNTHDVEVMNTETGAYAWQPLTGHTGQQGYHGAVLHPSEVLAGGLARDVLAAPGTYVVTEVRDDGGDFPDEPIGWSVLRLIREV